MKAYANSGKKRHMKQNCIMGKMQTNEDRTLLINRKLVSNNRRGQWRAVKGWLIAKTFEVEVEG